MRAGLPKMTPTAFLSSAQNNPEKDLSIAFTKSGVALGRIAGGFFYTPSAVVPRKFFRFF